MITITRATNGTYKVARAAFPAATPRATIAVSGLRYRSHVVGQVRRMLRDIEENQKGGQHGQD